jgi:hypothetical protein
MTQGGGKPLFFVPKWVEKNLKENAEINLASQPCPNDKWGKQNNEICRK